MARTKTATQSKTKTPKTSPPPSKPAAGQNGVRFVAITVPLADHADGGADMIEHIDVQLRQQGTRHQCHAARALFDGLQTQGVRMHNGKYVNNKNDIVRWLLEQIAEQDGSVSPSATGAQDG